MTRCAPAASFRLGIAQGLRHRFGVVAAADRINIGHKAACFQNIKAGLAEFGHEINVIIIAIR